MIKRSLSLLALLCGLLGSVRLSDAQSAERQVPQSLVRTIKMKSEGGHVEAWQNAYGDPDLWEWLAKQRRAK